MDCEIDKRSTAASEVRRNKEFGAGKDTRRSLRFDKEDKPRSWHTAFYYLAEHVKYLTRSKINHKVLYALVGTKGRYANHPNPLVRKSTAAELSRTVHSGAYAEDMRARFEQDGMAFDMAAHEVCQTICDAGGLTENELNRYLTSHCWPDVYRGLKNERAAWRSSLDLTRVSREAALLFESVDDNQFDRAPEPWVQFYAIFRFISFGYIDVNRMRLLLGATGDIPVQIPNEDSTAQIGACLVRFADDDNKSVVGFWVLPKDRPFVIGRFTDCDSVETDARISRRHARISCEDRTWVFQDLRSKNGSSIVRGANRIAAFDSQDSPGLVVLADGDYIVLADKSRYWFGSFDGKVTSIRF